MDTANAQSDLALVKGIVQKTSQRIDAHAFHCVHWGLIVLLWYPLANLCQQQYDIAPEAEKSFWFAWLLGIGIGSVTLGSLLSAFRGAKAARDPRLPGGNEYISRQLQSIAGSNILAGFALSWAAPATGFIDGPNVSIIWGLIYANMAFMMGVAYSRDFLVSGLFIFAGCIAAIVLQPFNGYILGPCMGLGMIIPGLRAEARVRRLVQTIPATEAN